MKRTSKYFVTVIAFALMVVIVFLLWPRNYNDVWSNSKKVLVVESYSMDNPGVHHFEQLCTRAFDKERCLVDIRYIYLDCDRYAESEASHYAYKQLDSLRLQGWTPQVIMVHDDPALNAMLTSGHRWVDKLPIVFGGVNYPNWSLISRFPNVTGFQDEIDLPRSMEVLRQFSENKTHIPFIYVLLDTTYQDRCARNSMMEFLQMESSGYVLVDNGTMVYEAHNGKMFATVDSLLTDEARTRFVEQCHNRGKMCIFLQSVTDPVRNGYLWSQLRTPGFYGNMLKVNSTNRIEEAENGCHSRKFSAISEQFGCGKLFIAGYIVPPREMVGEMTGVAVRILHGARPSDIAIKKSKRSYMADWEALNKMKIDYRQYLDKYRIVNIPLEVEYYWALAVLSLLAVVGIIMLIVFFCYRVRFFRRQRLELQVEVRQKTEEKAMMDKQIIQMAEEQYQSTRRLSEQQRKMEEMKLQLATANETLDKLRTSQEFVMQLAHELRGSLYDIMECNQKIAAQFPDFSTEHALINECHQRVLGNMARMKRLVGDLLDFGSAEAGNELMHIESIPLNELLTTVCMAERLQITHVPVIMHLDKNEVCVAADKVRLMQVFHHLLNNAGKFTSSGYITLDSEYDAVRGEVFVRVTDTGRGIEPNEMDQIFHCFSKGNHAVHCSGWGLAVSRNLVEQFQGRLEVSSTPGKGSVFTVVLPVV